MEVENSSLKQELHELRDKLDNSQLQEQSEICSLSTQLAASNTELALEKIQSNYMALSHKDWELPNWRIWLAEMDIDRGLDFPSRLVLFCSEKVAN